MSTTRKLVRADSADRFIELRDEVLAAAPAGVALVTAEGDEQAERLDGIADTAQTAIAGSVATAQTAAGQAGVHAANAGNSAATALLATTHLGHYGTKALLNAAIAAAGTLPSGTYLVLSDESKPALSPGVYPSWVYYVTGDAISGPGYAPAVLDASLGITLAGPTTTIWTGGIVRRVKALAADVASYGTADFGERVYRDPGQNADPSKGPNVVSTSGYNPTRGAAEGLANGPYYVRTIESNYSPAAGRWDFEVYDEYRARNGFAGRTNFIYLDKETGEIFRHFTSASVHRWLDGTGSDQDGEMVYNCPDDVLLLRPPGGRFRLTACDAEKGGAGAELVSLTTGVLGVTPGGSAVTRRVQTAGFSSLVTDSFTAADGTALEDHRADTGQRWTAEPGAWEINGNAAHYLGDGPIATVETYGTEQVLRVVAEVVSYALFGVVVRYADADNYIRMVAHPEGGIAVYRMEDGVQTTLEGGSFAPAIPVGGDLEVVVVATDTMVEMYLNGVIMARCSDTPSAGKTRAGVWMQAPGAHVVHGFSVTGGGVAG